MTRRSPARSQAGRKKRGGARRSASSAKAPLLTPARKRELSGILLIMLAVVTLVSFVSRGGSLTQLWVGWLQQGFGWGAYGLPLLLGAIGAWLLLDSMDEKADVTWSRPAGALGLYLSLLGLAHLALSIWRDRFPPETPVATDAAPLAGGALGAFVGDSLASFLGRLPTLAALMILAAACASLAAGLGIVRGSELLWQGIDRGARELWTRRGPAGDWLRARWSRLRDQSARSSDPIADPTAELEAPPDYAAGDGALPAEVEAAMRAAEARGKDVDATAAESESPPQPVIQAEWRKPVIGELLEPAAEVERAPGEAEEMARTIERSLGEFGVPVEVVKIHAGPTITQFGLEPGYIQKGDQRSRVSVRRIVALQNDLALALAASPVRILAPVPGRPYVGVEVPNKAKAVVSLRGVMESEDFARTAARGGLPIALGRDTAGRDVAVDLARMPHLLIAGATGSGKSVCVNALICSLLLTHTPETLKLILVDPKRVEMTQYRGLPHLATPVIVEAERVVGVLQWAVREMDRRYRRFAEAGARHLASYNLKLEASGQPRLPFLVIVIDELADLMMLAPEESERLITRLAQLARATGIHLVLATQRPSVDVVTGLIKANFPSRVAFAVSSSTDSRVILDSVGADKLLGQGDMLYMASDDSKLQRLQGCFVSDEELNSIVRYWKHSARIDAGAEAARSAHQPLGIPEPMIQPELWDQMVDPDKGALAPERDELWEQAVALIREHKSASTSFLQRKLRIGYSRAARLIDELEEAELIGPAQGNNPREVLIGPEAGEIPPDDYRSRLDRAFETRAQAALDPTTEGKDPSDEAFEDLDEDFDHADGLPAIDASATLPEPVEDAAGPIFPTEDSTVPDAPSRSEAEPSNGHEFGADDSSADDSNAADSEAADSEDPHPDPDPDLDDPDLDEASIRPWIEDLRQGGSG